MSTQERSLKTYKATIVALAAAVVVLLAVIAQMASSRGATAAPAQATATATVTVTATPDGAGAAPAPEPTTRPSLSDEEIAEQERFLLETLPKRQADDPLAKGAVDAKVVLTEWADYRCPFCSVWAEETLPQLAKFIDDGTLRIEFRDLAIFGDESIKAATAARAAGNQGKYFEFQHALFSALPNQGHPDIEDAVVMGIVEELGLDAAKFQTDWADPALEEAVMADSAEAGAMGVSSTPSFVIGTQFISGAQPLEVFEQIIAEQAAQRG